MTEPILGSMDSEASLLGQPYDYIVVGGGTAGLVVASRLTEDPHVQVLVIEAGADRRSDPRIYIPGLAVQTFDDPDFDWSFLTTPQKGLDGRQLYQPAGKGMGGSSSINMGMMVYPSASGFDAWESLGNPGWGWKDIVPYLQKFQTFHPPSLPVEEYLSLDYIDESLYGTAGPIQASFGDNITSYTPFNEAWPKAFQALGYGTTADPLSGISKGAFTTTGTVDPKAHKRSHAGSAYYDEEVARRPNLHLITETTVTRINFQASNKDSVVTTGVEVILKNGKKISIDAKLEVVVAAGAIKSPQLLELSGIGSAELLRSNGIACCINNKCVGENLQDHGYVPMSYEVADGQTSGDALRDPAVASAAVKAYTENNGAGPLGVCSLASAFMPIFDAATESGRRELEDLIKTSLHDPPYKVFPSKAKHHISLCKMLRNPAEASGQYTLTTFQITPEKGISPKQIFSMSTEGQYISIVSVLNHPFSRGATHITSSNPLDKPEVDTELLANSMDLELLARHVMWAEKLVQAEPFAKLLKPGGRRLPPRDSPEASMTLQQAKKIAKERTVPHYHLCGTCAMMPKSIGGVVDARLRVYGTKNLRVVDASVFPMIPRGNIQADVYAVAEKGADLIKQDLQDLRESEGVKQLLSEWRQARSGALEGVI